MGEMRVMDATSAQLAARRHLESVYGSDKIVSMTVSRVWFVAGKTRDVWEVEGEVVVKKGAFKKETRHFKFQIDPETGRVIGFEI